MTKFDILITTSFSFDGVSLKRDVKIALIIFFNVRVILIIRDLIPHQFTLCVFFKYCVDLTKICM